MQSQAPNLKQLDLVHCTAEFQHTFYSDVVLLWVILTMTHTRTQTMLMMIPMATLHTPKSSIKM